MIQLRNAESCKESITALGNALLKNDIFDEVAFIDEASIIQLQELLKSGISGLEFSPKSIIAKTPEQIDEKTSLEDQRRKHTTAMNRLKALYLYGDDELPEKDFILERKRILDAISEIDVKLSQFQNADETVYDESFTERASYFIMVEYLLNPSKIEPVELIRNIESGVIKVFLNIVLSKIVVTGSHVTEIHFKNGMVHKFVYK